LAGNLDATIGSIDRLAQNALNRAIEHGKALARR